MTVLTAATRGSELAIAQTEMIIDGLKDVFPDLEIKIKKVLTDGDIDKTTKLWELNESGFFTSQLEQVLLEGGADFAVHSFKDLPTKQPDGLVIAAVTKRDFSQDCMVAADKIKSISELPKNAKVGTSSLRRVVQIKKIRSDLVCVPLRGNVPTRIEKVKSGEIDAAILARAGIERLNLGIQISFTFDPNEFLPAPAQGFLAVQAVKGSNAEKIINKIDDKLSRITAEAERQILVTTQCGCHAPVGAFAKIEKNDIIIKAFMADPNGVKFVSSQIRADLKDGVSAAERLANGLLENGGRDLLREMNK